MDEKILEIISSFGFPAVVSLYVLMRIDKTLSILTQTISKVDAKLDAYLQIIHGPPSHIDRNGTAL